MPIRWAATTVPPMPITNSGWPWQRRPTLKCVPKVGTVGRARTPMGPSMAAGPGAPMSHITGVACYDHYVWSYTPVALGQYFNSGYMVTFCTQGSPPLSNVIGNHCYALLAWDAATDQFTLGNAWGFDYVDNHGVLVGEVTLSEAQLVSCVDDYAI